MRWTPGGRSSDIEDRRGGGGGFGGLGGGKGIGIGGAIILLVLSLIFRQNLFTLVGADGGVPGDTTASGAVSTTPEEEKRVEFVSFVLDDTQSTWERLFQARGRTYEHAKLVLFRDAIRSACGFAESASGPFYCPGDERVYIDLGFFDELKQRFGAPGDFAQAYVLAHELGHHVQRLLGTEGESVRIELQADCYAGVWGHETAQRQLLEAGDVEEGLGAAAAVGDDRIQRMSGQEVHPEAFTHGSAEQRASWFRRGFESGRPEDCDTFRS
jgi:uncharacterized protein